MGAVPDSDAARAERHLVLIGTMGAGKTTTGRLVAARLGWPFRDNDTRLVEEAGRSAEELAAAEGAASLHRREAAILLDCLAADGPDVVAAAASTVLDGPARAALRADAFVVWLHTTESTLDARLAHPGDRPSFGSTPAEVAGRLQADRSALYREVADREVDTTGRAPEDVASWILGELDAVRDDGSAGAGRGG